ncbi:S8 family serine peptidase [Gottfriedia luciferensis]|uniref:S8 family serine peptidase n=1 Tax=Gottfriedia luciferensis TaxID=178774 RepID=UPI000B435EE8|nr:S8 family serine peptidase [Gottfriedia luciferensis]
MGKRLKRSKLANGFTVLALTSSVVVAPIAHVTNVSKAAGKTNTETILANLTSEQRAALKQISTNEARGLHISSEVDQKTTKQTSVIVEFSNKPAKVATIEAQSEGKSLTEADAAKLVDQDHATFSNDVGQVLKDENNKKVDFKIKRSYKNAFNGVSMSLPANQIKNLLKSKAVKTVWSNEKFSIDPPKDSDKNSNLKADESKVANYTPYDGLDKLHAEGFTGKGIKIGILDTGIDYHHPDLKDAFKGGYDFVDNDNDPMETTYADWVKAGKPGYENGSDYYTEHGTHVAGIIGGRGKSNSEYKQLGVAPEADLYSYRVLGPGGMGESDNIIAAIDKAVKDGMNVINMSLGASLNDPLYATSVAVNNAVLSGVTTVVAAGNDGDNMYTLGSPGAAALALTVGASSVAIDLYQFSGTQNGSNYTLRQLAQNYSDDIPALKGSTNELVDVGLGYPEDYTGKDLKGKIAYIQRGEFALIDKIKNAKAAGAVGVLMANNVANKNEGAIQAFLGESVDAIPSFSVSYDEGLKITEAIKAGKNDVSFGDYSKVQTASDELAGFSSRGPSRMNYDIKPEVTAPGVSILSTVPFYVNNSTADGSKPEDYKYAYERLSGTSMATPYVAGVSALLLQSNQDLQPEDIKSILMNTADPLSKAYSVFEVGSGRVDAYEAIHSNVELEVVDKTPTIVNGKQKTIKELTGGMSFGSFGFDNKNISESRNVTLKNRSEKEKTFSVAVKYQTGLRGSKDAATNNVTLSGPTSVKLNGNSSKSFKFDLNIPKKAEKGTYEGYVTFTNNADPTEQYQIPFGVRVVDEGIDTFGLYNPIFTTKITNPTYAYPFMDGYLSIKSFMKTLDVVIQDPTTGEDIGYVGSFNTQYLDENYLYSIGRLVGAIYYPFTDDPKNPISNDYKVLRPGHYKLKLVGTSESGKTFSKSTDFMLEFGTPKITSSFDTLDQKVIEYNDSQLDSNGEFLYDFKLHVNDPEIDEAAKYGIQADQSQNTIVTRWGEWGFPSSPINVDKNGDFSDQILVDSSMPELPVTFYGLDAALNASSQIKVVFLKNTTPYYYLKANKHTATTGDTINYSVRSNNIKNLKTSIVTMNVFNQQASIENVKVNDAVTQYGDAKVTVSTAPTAWDDTTQYSFTFNYLGSKNLPEDLQLFDFDVKTLDKAYTAGTAIQTYNVNTATIDQSNVRTEDVYNYTENYDLTAKVSNLEGSLQLEGEIDPTTGEPNWSLDKSKIGAKVTLKSYDGKTVLNAPITSTDGQYSFDGVKVDSKPYTITVDVPGHFTMSKSVDFLSDNIRGVLTGRYMRDLLPIAPAGDENKDNVIDILDALAVQTYWGTSKASADFNFDKVVDAKDMDFVIKNYGLQNSTVPNPPKAKNTYKGATLDSILAQLGLKK